jgi:protein-tyrosine phosphatase
MKISNVVSIFGIQALAFSSLAVYHGLYDRKFPFFIWCGSVFGYVSFCYWYDPTLALRLIRKDVKTGYILAPSLIFFSPWLIEVWSFWLVKQWILTKKGEPFCDLVYTRPVTGQRFFVSRFPLHPLPTGISYMCDLTLEFSAFYLRAFKHKKLHYMCSPSLDICMPPATKIINMIKILYDSTQGDVFVHCANGHGRSALIVAAVMVMDSKNKLTFSDCKKEMRKSRPLISWQEAQELCAREAVDLILHKNLNGGDVEMKVVSPEKNFSKLD